MRLELLWREEDGVRLPSRVWRAGPGRRMISSAMLGGGIAPATWVLNAQVPGGYARMDPVRHLHELASAHGLAGPGVGLLTAADVTKLVHREDGGVEAAATVGLRVPTWAAAPPDAVDPELAPIRQPDTAPRAGVVWRPGTINILVSVPAVLSEAALVNAVITATEAKTQALLEAGYPCTGTASDAICIAALAETPDAVVEPFAGPRSEWGARIARAVHAAVLTGALAYEPHAPTTS